MYTNLTEVMPHRPPLLLLDAIVKWDEDSACSEKTFRDGDYGLDNGNVLESALTECIAQTVAAKHGLNALKKNKEPDKGMLVGIDKLEFFMPVEKDSRLTINVEKSYSFGPFVIVDGTIHKDKELVAKGSMKLYLMEDV